nr:AP-1 complex subunit gamma-2-like [Tanacetum cinerariifolium]
YVALNMLMKAITIDGQAVQRHQATILESVKVGGHINPFPLGGRNYYGKEIDSLNTNGLESFKRQLLYLIALQKMEDDDEWLMEPVTSPRATVTLSSTYEVGGPSSTTLETLFLKMGTVSDAQVANCIVVGEIWPRVTTVEGQVESRVETYLSGYVTGQGQDIRLAEMDCRESTLMSYMLWMEERLAVLEKKLPRPLPGSQ